MAVGGTVAVVVGADPVLIRVAVGALGDGAEVELFRSSELVGHADREGRGGVAVDAIGSAAGGGDLARAYGLVRVCGCKVEDGGEADQERGVLHRAKMVMIGRCVSSRQSKSRDDGVLSPWGQ